MPLKPCHFCGGTPSTDTESLCDDNGENHEVLYSVNCWNCNVYMTGVGATCDEAEIDVFTKWNRRATDAEKLR